jgi:uncharacterized protein YdaU (DUF1376 family)
MNYYSHHIGDFDRATRHLTRIERSIYRDLLDVYYDTEQPLTLDLPALQRKVIARTNEEATAVEQVLSEFFTQTPAGWYHDRCEEELEAYRASNTQKSIAGKASAAKRASKRQQALNGNPTAVETPLNVRGTALQLTNNQEPITNKDKTMSEQSPDAVTVDRRKREPSPDDASLASRIFGLILEGNPAAKKPNLNTWADDIRLMREQDKRTLPEIWSLFQWVRKHHFWRTVVLCPGKLREKYDQLVEVRAAPAQPARGEPPINEKFNFGHLDRSGDARAMEESMKRHGVTVPDDMEIDL